MDTLNNLTSDTPDYPIIAAIFTSSWDGGYYESSTDCSWNLETGEVLNIQSDNHLPDHLNHLDYESVTGVIIHPVTGVKSTFSKTVIDPINVLTVPIFTARQRGS